VNGYKTVIFSFLLVVLGALEQTGVLALVPEQYQGAVLSAIGFVTLVLRFLTNSPVFQKPVEELEEIDG
jgi:hypothetical protein